MSCHWGRLAGWGCSLPWLAHWADKGHSCTHWSLLCSYHRADETAAFPSKCTLSQPLSEGFCLQCWGLDLTGELGPIWLSSVALRGQDVSLPSSPTRLLWRPRPLSSVPEVDDNRPEFRCWLSSGSKARLQSIDCFLNEQTDMAEPIGSRVLVWHLWG